MMTLHRTLGDGRRCRIRITDRHDGDANDASRWADERSRWVAPVQVHGADVAIVESAAGAPVAEADAVCTAHSGPVLVIRTADCVPLTIYGWQAIAVVHAGWRGLDAGVIGAAATAVRHLSAGPLRAIVGPYIHPEHYEFGSEQLAQLAHRWGPEVVSHTTDGRPALHLGAAVRVALGRAGVAVDHDVARCTAADVRYFSYRARAEVERLAMLVDIEGSGVSGAR